ncbi:MAG: septum formation initiator family protein [Ignavibacteriales bacterium]|nr:septum formation initiator family protein [Ignavibacteriales bacterium]
MKKVSNKKDRIITWIYFVILIILVLFLFFNKYGLLKYFELKNEINSIERQIDKSKNQINDLDSNINSIKTDDKELEKVAREKFMMKKENEKVFKFEDKNDSLGN